MRQKLLMIPLILALLLGCICPVHAAFGDTAGLPCEKAVEKIAALGLVEGREDGTFAPDETLTRAEMATIVLRLLNLTASETQQIFTDVPSTHWGFAAVGSAYKAGIVNGTSATTFAPDAAVTYPQAVKMLVGALGYGVKAEAAGGYPTGYLSVASQIGLLAGVANADGAITRGTMAQLVSNAVEIDILERTGYGADYSVAIREGDTVLSTYLHINKYEGKITANGVTTLEGVAVRENQIAMGEKVFEVGETAAASFLGRRVSLYAKEENDIETVLYIEAKASSDSLTVDVSDILPKSTPATLYYEVENKEYAVDIAPGAVWIYNGVRKTDMTPTDLLFATGTVELISTNGKTAETVLIRSFQNVVVDSVRPEEYKLIFKDRSAELTTLVLDPTDTSYRFTFLNEDGSAAAVEACAEWDVLSVAVSEDDRVMEVIRSTRIAAGKVEEMGTETVTVAGTSYEVAANLRSETTELKKPELGMEANFRLDFTGKVAAVDNENYRNTRYGWLVGGQKAKGIDGTTQLKIFTEDGIMKLFTVSDKCKVNGNPSTDVLGESVLHTGTAIIEQLLLFQATAEDEIVEIETAVENTDFSLREEERLAKFSRDFYSDRIGIIGYESKIFATRYLIRDISKIFIVPNQYTGDDKLYSVRNWADVGHVGAGGTYNGLSLYDINEDNIVSAMVSRDTVSAIPTGDPGVITHIAQTITEDGEPVMKLTLERKNDTATVLVKEDLAVITENVLSDPAKDPAAVEGVLPASLKPSQLERGDVVQYDMSTMTGEATAMRVLLRSGSRLAGERANNEGGQNATGNLTADSDYIGSVYAYAQTDKVSEYGARIYVTHEKRTGPETYERIRHFNGPKIVLYDSQRDTFKTITSAEIYDGDWIFAYKMNATERIIVVYR
ncbi:MAG: S-layer homology domain-containing protein [Ruminococcaceae bacterium]|nr:S-layer homology domain-containing protein [Oscillospiraceae bacterium]